MLMSAVIACGGSLTDGFVASFHDSTLLLLSRYLLKLRSVSLLVLVGILEKKGLLSGLCNALLKYICVDAKGHPVSVALIVCLCTEYPFGSMCFNMLTQSSASHSDVVAVGGT